MEGSNFPRGKGSGGGIGSISITASTNKNNNHIRFDNNNGDEKPVEKVNTFEKNDFIEETKNKKYYKNKLVKKQGGILLKETPLIESIKFKDYTPNIKVLGVIKTLAQNYCIVSLPNMFTGFYFSPEENLMEKLCFLNRMCAVRIKETLMESSDDNKTKRQILVSFEPNEVNSGLTFDVMHVGMMIRGKITSSEDYGYIVDVGLLGVTAFLKSTQIEFQEGIILDLKISHKDKKGHLTLQYSDEYANTEVKLQNESIHSLIPGFYIKFSFVKYCQNGILVKLGSKGLIQGAIELSHLFQYPSHDWHEDWKEVLKNIQNCKARILCVDATLKIVRLSMLKHIVDMNGSDLVKDVRVGSLVKDATVVRLDNYFGALLLADLGNVCSKQEEKLLLQAEEQKEDAEKKKEEIYSTKDITNTTIANERNEAENDNSSKNVSASSEESTNKDSKKKNKESEKNAEEAQNSNGDEEIHEKAEESEEESLNDDNFPNNLTLDDEDAEFNKYIDLDALTNPSKKDDIYADYVEDDDDEEAQEKEKSNEITKELKEENRIPIYINFFKENHSSTKQLNQLFTVGNKIPKVRVLSNNKHLIEHILEGTCHPEALLSTSILSARDLVPGKIYQVTIEKIQVDSTKNTIKLHVSLPGVPTSIPAIITSQHFFDKGQLSNYKLSHLSTKYKLKQKIQAKYLNHDSRTKKHYMTLKPSFLEGSNIISTDAKINDIGVGFVTKINYHGLHVAFYNDAHGLVPARECQVFVQDWKTEFDVGDSCQCRIISKQANGALLLSLYLEKETRLEVGTIIHKNCMKVYHLTSKAMWVSISLNKKKSRGFIPLRHSLTNYGVGQVISTKARVLCHTEQEMTMITLQPGLLDNFVPKDLNEISVGMTVTGYIECHDERFGTFVKFLNNLKGLIRKLHYSRIEHLDVFSPVTCEIIKIDGNKLSLVPKLEKDKKLEQNKKRKATTSSEKVEKKIKADKSKQKSKKNEKPIAKGKKIMAKGKKMNDVVRCVVKTIAKHGIYVSTKNNATGYIKRNQISKDKTFDLASKFRRGTIVRAKVLKKGDDKLILTMINV